MVKCKTNKQKCRGVKKHEIHFKENFVAVCFSVFFFRITGIQLCPLIIILGPEDFKCSINVYDYSIFQSSEATKKWGEGEVAMIVMHFILMIHTMMNDLRLVQLF